MIVILIVIFSHAHGIFTNSMQQKHQVDCNCDWWEMNIIAMAMSIRLLAASCWSIFRGIFQVFFPWTLKPFYFQFHTESHFWNNQVLISADDFLRLGNIVRAINDRKLTTMVENWFLWRAILCVSFCQQRKVSFLPLQPLFCPPFEFFKRYRDYAVGTTKNEIRAANLKLP